MKKDQNRYFGKYFWIGANSSILAGIKLKNDVYRRGEAVNKESLAYSVIVGSPAKKNKGS